MTKKLIDPIDIVGVKEAAAILDWDPRRVTTYRNRNKFPEPVKVLAMGPIWVKQQIEEYAEQFKSSD